LDPEPSLEIASQVDLTLIFGFIGIIILLFCSALVSGAEVALFSLSQKDLDDTIQENSSKGKIIVNLLEKPKKL
jgi:putative hemolysin